MILETILILLAAGACLLSYLGAATTLPLLALALITILHLILRPTRWQTYPIHLLTACLCIAIASQMEVSGWPRHVLAITSTALILVSAALVYGLPTWSLPGPSGLHAVGVSSIACERTPATEPVRRLQLKIWYPAQPIATPGSRPETFWREFQSRDVAPAPLRFLTSYLRHIPTHACADAPPAPPPRDGFPTLIYSHSGIAIASETTLLMEELASTGYVVVAIRHADQLQEMTATSRAISAAERSRDRNLQRQLLKTDNRAQRADLSAQLFDNSTGMPKIVQRRAEDARFIIDQLLAPHPSLELGKHQLPIDPTRIGALGLSLGGAVSMEACNADTRCRAVANLDGGLFGASRNTQPRIPHLMLYSAANEGTNDAYLHRNAPDYAEAVLPNSKHMDLHDITAIAPLLRITSLLGATSGREAVALRNRTVRDFFEKNLPA